VRGKRVRFSEEVADLICARVAAGESMTAVCRDEGMPHPTSVYAWIRERMRRGQRVED
jgi:transposase-like protein